MFNIKKKCNITIKFPKQHLKTINFTDTNYSDGKIFHEQKIPKKYLLKTDKNLER